MTIVRLTNTPLTYVCGSKNIQCSQQKSDTFLLFVTVEASLVLLSDDDNDDDDETKKNQDFDKVETIQVIEEDVIDLRGKVRVQQQSTNATSNLFNIFESSTESRKNALFNMSSSVPSSSSSHKKISSQLLIFEISSKRSKKLRPLCRVSMPWWLEAPDLMCMRRRNQFIDLAISSHSATKMLCLRLKHFNSTITKTRSCVVGFASNMRLKGITCSSRSVRFLYVVFDLISRSLSQRISYFSFTYTQRISYLLRGLARVTYTTPHNSHTLVFFTRKNTTQMFFGNTGTRNITNLVTRFTLLP